MTIKILLEDQHVYEMLWNDIKYSPSHLMLTIFLKTCISNILCNSYKRYCLSYNSFNLNWDPMSWIELRRSQKLTFSQYQSALQLTPDTKKAEFEAECPGPLQRLTCASQLRSKVSRFLLLVHPCRVHSGTKWRFE